MFIVIPEIARSAEVDQCAVILLCFCWQTADQIYSEHCAKSAAMTIWDVSCENDYYSQKAEERKCAYTNGINLWTTYLFGYSASWNIPVMPVSVKLHFEQCISRPANSGYACNFSTLPTWRQSSRSVRGATAFLLLLLRVDCNKGFFGGWSDRYMSQVITDAKT